MIMEREREKDLKRYYHSPAAHFWPLEPEDIAAIRYGRHTARGMRERAEAQKKAGRSR